MGLNFNRCCCRNDYRGLILKSSGSKKNGSKPGTVGLILDAIAVYFSVYQNVDSFKAGIALQQQLLISRQLLKTDKFDSFIMRSLNFH